MSARKDPGYTPADRVAIGIGYVLSIAVIVGVYALVGFIGGLPL